MLQARAATVPQGLEPVVEGSVQDGREHPAKGQQGEAKQGGREEDGDQQGGCGAGSAGAQGAKVPIRAGSAGLPTKPCTTTIDTCTRT